MSIVKQEPARTESPDVISEAEGLVVSRRQMMQGAAAVSTLATVACSDNDLPNIMQPPANAQTPLAGVTFGEAPADRIQSFVNLRVTNADRQAARFDANVQDNNGDEARYADFRGSFSKTLLHNEFGEVDQASYESFLNALDSRNPADFDAIITGSPNETNRVGLVEPQAAFSFDQSALDSNGYRMLTAPAFASAETAVEMTELYWYSLNRDIPFTEYDTNPDIAAAASDLQAAIDTTGISLEFSRGGEPLTPANIFRGTFAGADTGPLVSQFLYQPFFFGLLEVEQRYDTPISGTANQFMTSYDEWLNIQNGFAPAGSTVFRGSKRFMATMRDLGEFVHVDFPIQSPLHAFSILLGFGEEALDPNIPYSSLNAVGPRTQEAFTSFGAGGLPHLVTQASRLGLLGAWFQKWAAHRRLRPEVFAGRLNNHVRGRRDYDFNDIAIMTEAWDRVVAATGGASSTNRGLLPMGYPEGSPAHPAYPGGHSTFSAAGATVCKAIFNEDFVIPNPVQANATGTALIPWTGADLTVGGELNKLVGNITHGRDAMGMHWRTDGLGNFIGENVAITLLCDYSRTYNDDFGGFQLTRFNGDRILIRNGQVLAN